MYTEVLTKYAVKAFSVFVKVMVVGVIVHA